MEQAEELQKHAPEPVREEVAQARTSSEAKGRRQVDRWVLGTTIGMQVLVLALLAAEGRLLNGRIDGLVRTQGDLAKAHAAEVAALNERTDTLKGEVEVLRQTLVESTSEDVLFLKILVIKPDIDVELARTVARLVHRYSGIYGRDPNLVLAIIAVESRFNPKAVSPVGATGLMQVMPHWKKVLGIETDLTDPETSIRYGLQILGFYQEMYKDLEMALTAYNRGPGPVDRALVKGENPKNGYGAQVLAFYDKLKRLNVRVASR